MFAVEESKPFAAKQEVYRLIREELAPHLPAWRRCRSTRELASEPNYRALETKIRKVLEHQDVGEAARAPAPARSTYRLLAWNLERGIELDRQLEAFRTHPYLRTSDVLFLTETDVGMARSRNRAVAQTLARDLGFHYAFVPCYLNLTKGAGIEYDSPGENTLGLHGNAVVSRYPIRRVRAIRLKNGIDKMAGREKRLGCQKAIAADIDFPNYAITAVALHLDTNSSQRHRREQMRQVLEGLETHRPVVIGGDWNTTTYNASRAFYAIMGYWLRVFMGPDNVIRNHFLHPDRHFEKGLFELLGSNGFDYRASNVPGERTTTYDAADPKTRQNLGEWVPGWCFAFIRWALRHTDGRCPLKIDWFATRDISAQNPVILHDLREGREPALSDHDAIGVDIVVP